MASRFGQEDLALCRKLQKLIQSNVDLYYVMHGTDAPNWAVQEYYEQEFKVLLDTLSGWDTDPSDHLRITMEDGAVEIETKSILGESALELWQEVEGE